MAKLGSRASYGGTVVEEITAAKTLDPSDSGKVFTINAASAYTVSLPKAADAGAGWNCKFIVTTGGSADVTIAPDSSEDTLIGMIASADGSNAESSHTGVDELKFLSACEPGEWAELLCDGSNFYVSGMEHDSNHMSLA
tara:strand:- start:11886 stop:12302 length:417 start_codon:yes stop_codon:yes gene_type:complete